MLVKYLVGIELMLGVVLAENKIHELAVIVNDGQRIQLMVPNDVVCFLEGGIPGGGNKFGKRSHKLADLGAHIHAAYAVVAARHDAYKLTVCSTVLGDGNGGKTVALFKLENVRQCLVGHDIGSGGNKAGLIILDP